jgi:hypothetical protein
MSDQQQDKVPPSADPDRRQDKTPPSADPDRRASDQGKAHSPGSQSGALFNFHQTTGDGGGKNTIKKIVYNAEGKVSGWVKGGVVLTALGLLLAAFVNKDKIAYLFDDNAHRPPSAYAVIVQARTGRSQPVEAIELLRRSVKTSAGVR